MQNKQMMRVFFMWRGNCLIQFFLDFQYVFADCQTGTVGDPEYMGVDGDGRQAESRVQNHIGGFTADSRQRLQGGSVLRHFAIVPSQQGFAELDDIGGLAIEQTDGLDIFLQAGLAQRQNRLWGIGDWKQFGRRLVYALIGGLGR